MAGTANRAHGAFLIMAVVALPKRKSLTALVPLVPTTMRSTSCFVAFSNMPCTTDAFSSTIKSILQPSQVSPRCSVQNSFNLLWFSIKSLFSFLMWLIETVLSVIGISNTCITNNFASNFFVNRWANRKAATEFWE